MSQDLKDYFQLGAWGVAIIGGLIAAFKAVAEMRRSNEQRREDMRWKQAEMAKKCIDEIFSNANTRAALRMLDWTGSIYAKPDNTKTGRITHESRRLALRTKDPTSLPGNDSPLIRDAYEEHRQVLRTDDPIFLPGDDGPFIRDAYDQLFDEFERLEHFIRIKLILFEDVRQRLSYYIDKLALQEERAAIQPFLQEYGFTLAQDFLTRFPVWTGATSQNTSHPTKEPKHLT
ncbi:MAG: hypothetical protein JNK38_21200 [Acidobacteria bacterium]|nr:hypothetical protein [Acidobacteriota bacterium]